MNIKVTITMKVSRILNEKKKCKQKISIDSIYSFHLNTKAIKSKIVFEQKLAGGDSIQTSIASSK